MTSALPPLDIDFDETWSDDGLAMTIGAYNAKGVWVEVAVRWRTPELVEANALRTRNRMLEFIALHTDDRPVGARQRWKGVGGWGLQLLTGPPTSWLPRFTTRDKEGRRTYLLGWLRVAVCVTPPVARQT